MLSRVLILKLVTKLQHHAIFQQYRRISLFLERQDTRLAYSKNYGIIVIFPGFKNVLKNILQYFPFFYFLILINANFRRNFYTS